MSRLIFLVSLLAACPRGDDTPDGPDVATVELAGQCDVAADWGGFTVVSHPEDVGVQGNVADGVVPVAVLEEVATEGDCRMLRRNNPFCDPACEAGFTCDFDGTCIPYPKNQDLGIVTVTGLANDVSMEPVFPGNTYFDTSLPDPPYTPSELVTLDAPGTPWGDITLYGVGLEVPSVTGDEWSIESGVDLVVQWSAPTTEVVRSKVFVTVNIDQHGTSPSQLRCLFDDDGDGTVPSSMIDELVSRGVTGFPSGLLERRTADSAPLGDDGCMDLLVAAPIEVDVDVVGFTPCVSDNECPEPLECNEELQICE